MIWEILTNYLSASIYAGRRRRSHAKSRELGIGRNSWRLRNRDREQDRARTNKRAARLVDWTGDSAAREPKRRRRELYYSWLGGQDIKLRGYKAEASSLAKQRAVSSREPVHRVRDLVVDRLLSSLGLSRTAWPKWSPNARFCRSTTKLALPSFSSLLAS